MLNPTNFLIREDHSLMTEHSCLKGMCLTFTCGVSPLSLWEGGKMRDPGNEVEQICPLMYCKSKCPLWLWIANPLVMMDLGHDLVIYMYNDLFRQHCPFAEWCLFVVQIAGKPISIIIYLFQGGVCSWTPLLVWIFCSDVISWYPPAKTLIEIPVHYVHTVNMTLEPWTLDILCTPFLCDYITWESSSQKYTRLG